MSDEMLSSASDAGAETAVVNEAPAIEVEEKPAPPSSSTREALERAMAKVEASQPRDPATQRFMEKGKDATAAPEKAAVAPPQAQLTSNEALGLSPPPDRFSKEAKEAWATAPEAIRKETERAFAEMTKGLTEYQQRWEPIKQWDEMARQSGKELPSVIAEYVNMENALRDNPIAGFSLLCQRLGLDVSQVGQALSGQSPTQGGMSPDVAPLLNKISELERQISGVSQSFQQREVQAQVDAFAASHERFEELSPLMIEMISTGFAKDLPDAYDKASKLQPPAPVVQHPALAAPAAQPAPPRAQTPKPTLQITGSPAGSDPSTRKPAGSASEAVQRAMAAVGIN
jgi:hypothetical protein